MSVMPGDVVGLERAILDVAGRIGDREHHRALAEHRAAARTAARSRRAPSGRGPADGRSRATAIDSTSNRPASPPARPTSRRSMLRKMSDSRISPVTASIVERRRAQRPVEVRARSESDHRSLVVDARLGAGEAHELRGDGRGRGTCVHVAERAVERRLKLRAVTPVTSRLVTR